MSQIIKIKARFAGNKSLSDFATFMLVVTEKIFKYSYNPENYNESFISDVPKIETILNPAPEIIYIFWTGENEMSEQRKKSIQTLEKKSDVKVQVVSPDNVLAYIKPAFPLHCAYNYLSLVHKSDYLRCYFMLHYGGGYSDVKACRKSWKASFNKLNNGKHYALGYREILGGLATLDKKNGKIRYDVKRYYFKTLGVCSFIFKPNSPIAEEWMCELNSRLDILQDDLIRNPGNIWGDNSGYPVPWNFILSQIIHPLFLKYSEFLLMDEDVRPIFKNYR